MANDNLPRGLFPINYPNMSCHYYRVQTGVNVFLGEAVDIDSTGYVTNAVNVGSNGQAVFLLGSVVGFAGPLKKGLVGGNDPFLRASDLTTLATGLEAGDRWALVADDPYQEFLIQGDSGGTMASLAAAGEGATLIYRSGGSGNTTNGWANLELDASTNTTGTNNVVRLVRLHDAVNVDGTENTGAVAFAKWVVNILNHRKLGTPVISTIV
jgi:hypothetical protein